MPNHLGSETSPYLLQHAANPVDWHPWNETALALARRLDRPILLSIGYSACHWCHVMAHESFADEATAAVMNRLFVNLKVDREERPDLDQIYQTAHQVLTRRAGGWPLTMFLTPAGLPFYGGTYFPKHPRHGLPSFTALLERVADVFANRRQEVEEQGRAVVDVLARSSHPDPGTAAEISEAPIRAAVAELVDQFDPRHGGFGDAPKFPRPTDLAFLLRHHFRSGDMRALEIATTTLRQMAEGGIFDQLGGGFFRYSVDAAWEIPHFEKMLYDNALLLGVYADAWCISREPLFARTVERTIGWVAREMTAADGGFHSSLDADSEGEEGRFYVWRREEIESLLDADERKLAGRCFGLDAPANFEGEAWHLRALPSISPSEEEARRIESIRARLRMAREKRIRPGRDDKCLVSWNALMIGALARAARVFQRPDWLEQARRSMAFIERVHWREGRLLTTSKDGRAHLNAYLDDYAFLLDALLELAQSDCRSADLAFAGRVADALLQGFVDRENGGFFFTSDDHETLIQRPRSVHDNATPAGSAIAIRGLLRLGRASGDERYTDAGEAALAAEFPGLHAWPSGAASMLGALDEMVNGGRLLVLGGVGPAAAEWRRELGRIHAPDTICLWPKADDPDLPPPLRVAVTDGPPLARLCRRDACLPPEGRLEAVIASLSG